MVKRGIRVPPRGGVCSEKVSKVKKGWGGRKEEYIAIAIANFLPALSSSHPLSLRPHQNDNPTLGIEIFKDVHAVPIERAYLTTTTSKYFGTSRRHLFPFRLVLRYLQGVREM